MHNLVSFHHGRQVGCQLVLQLVVLWLYAEHSQVFVRLLQSAAPWEVGEEVHDVGFERLHFLVALHRGGGHAAGALVLQAQIGGGCSACTGDSENFPRLLYRTGQTVSHSPCKGNPPSIERVDSPPMQGCRFPPRQCNY